MQNDIFHYKIINLIIMGVKSQFCKYNFFNLIFMGVKWHLKSKTDEFCEYKLFNYSIQATVTPWKYDFPKYYQIFAG